MENCVEVLDNKRSPINANERKHRSGPVPYYGATGQVGWIDDYLFNEEIILLGEDGAPFLDGAKNKAYIISGKSWVNNHAHVLKAIKTITSNKFLAYFLNQFNYRDYVTGTTRLKLNQSRMREIPVLLPLLNEQHRIVTKIESIFAQIDACKKNLEGLVSQSSSSHGSLAQLRSRVLKQAFEGKLVPQNSDDESAEMLLKKLCIDSKIDPVLDDLPKGWLSVALGLIIEPSNEKFNPKTKENRTYMGLEHIESSTNRIVGYGDSNATKSTKTVFRKGDVLYGKLRPYLNKVCIPNFDGVCSTDILVFPKNPHLYNKYLSWFLSTDEFVRHATKHSTGVTLPRVNFKTIAKYSFLLPPLHEQRRIVAKIESIFTKINTMNTYIKSTLRLLDMLKSRTLRQAFEGKLVPQDPNDEPATRLLEQIQYGSSKDVQ